MQRRGQRDDFAIAGERQRERAGGNRGGGGVTDIEVLGCIDLASETLREQADDGPAGLHARRVDREASLIELRSKGGVEDLAGVAIVGDDDERGAERRNAFGCFDAKRETAQLAKDVPRGDGHGAPFAVAAFATECVASPEGFAVGTEGTVVDEDAAVDLGDIDVAHRGGGEGPSGFAPIGREAEVADKVVERAERKRTEREIASGELASDGTDGAVPAAGEDDVGPASDGVAHGPLQAEAVDFEHGEADAELGEGMAQFFGRRGIVGARGGAGSRVEDQDRFHAR